MPVVKVSRRRQVVIPKALYEELGLKPGDTLEVRVEGDKLVYVPQKPKPEEAERDAWYESSEG